MWPQWACRVWEDRRTPETGRNHRSEINNHFKSNTPFEDYLDHQKRPFCLKECNKIWNFRLKFFKNLNKGSVIKIKETDLWRKNRSVENNLKIPLECPDGTGASWTFWDLGAGSTTRANGWRPPITASSKSWFDLKYQFILPFLHKKTFSKTQPKTPKIFR